MDKSTGGLKAAQAAVSRGFLGSAPGGNTQEIEEEKSSSMHTSKLGSRFTTTEVVPNKSANPGKSPMNSTHISGSAGPVEAANVKKFGYSQRSAETGGSDEEDEGEGDDDDDEDLDIRNSDLIFHPESMLRQWLKKRGKQHCIDFDDEELRQLRSYFNSLDEDGSGAIGVDELEDPLIALGLVENRQQVAQIVAMVDEDGSQQIEFDEFLSIIKGGNSSKQQPHSATEDGSSPKKKTGSALSNTQGSSTSQGAVINAKQEAQAQATGSGAIFEFFKKLTSGELKVDSEDKIIPFSIFISTYRRKKILAAMMGKNQKEKEEGTRILNNYKKQLAEKMAREKAERGESLSNTAYSMKTKSNGGSSKGGKDKKSNKSSKSARKQKQAEAAAAVMSMDSMEPDILLRILHGKGGLGGSQSTTKK